MNTKEIASEVGLTITPTYERIKRLEVLTIFIFSPITLSYPNPSIITCEFFIILSLSLSIS